MSSESPTTNDDRLLFELKSRGPQAAATLAAALAITPMGAHKLLARLEEMGLVTSREDSRQAGEAARIGRPRKLWALTVPYFLSKEAPIANTLLGVSIAMVLGTVYVNVLLNTWYGDFQNMLQAKDLSAVPVDFFGHHITTVNKFIYLIGKFTLIVFPAVILGGLGTLGVVALWMWLFPPLRTVDRLTDVEPISPSGKPA